MAHGDAWAGSQAAARSLAATLSLGDYVTHYTDESDVRELRDEAASAGDLAQVAICDRAIEGDAGARAECDRVIAAAADEPGEAVIDSLRTILRPRGLALATDDRGLRVVARETEP